MEQDFRQILKTETRADHERVDALISTIDISISAGLSQFLTIHKTCFNIMADCAAAGSDTKAGLCDMLRCLDQDRDALGADVVPVSGVSQGTFDPLALDYVIEGSRLGSQILKRRWASSTDPIVRRADAYFELPPVPGRWRAVCEALSAVPADGQRAMTIIQDTKEIFALFQLTAEAHVGSRHQAVEYAT